MAKPPRNRPGGERSPQLKPNPQALQVAPTTEEPNSGSTDVPESGTTEVAQGDGDHRSAVPPDSRTTDVPSSGTTELTNSGSAGIPQSGSAGMPKYQQMERRDIRLRPDQWFELDQLRTRVSRNRNDRSERITTATLMRIAADVLIARSDDLTGNTEDELRHSLGLN